MDAEFVDASLWRNSFLSPIFHILGQNYHKLMCPRHEVDDKNASGKLYLPTVHLLPVNPSGQMQRNPPRSGKQTDRL